MIRFLQNNREASVAIIIVLLLAILAISDPSYLRFETLLSIYSNSLTLFVLAIGATMVMATRGLDVSVGSIMGLSAAIAGVCMNDGLGMMASIGIALFVGLCCGLFNGFMVAILRVPAIVATLGTLGFFRGCVHLTTGGSWIEGLPEGFKDLSHAWLLGLSPFAWLVLLLLAAAHIFLRYTAFGHAIFAVGDNREGARLLGYPRQQGSADCLCHQRHSLGSGRHHLCRPDRFHSQYCGQWHGNAGDCFRCSGRRQPAGGNRNGDRARRLAPSS